MKRPKHMRAQLGAILRSCTDVAERVGVDAVRKVVERVDGASLNGPAQRVVDAVAQGTEKLIAKSPVPIPKPIREALESMREALGQLSSSIDVVNAGASSLQKDAAGTDPTRRQAMEDARAAFVDLDMSDSDESGQKKPRRHRSRRNGHRQAASQDENRQNAPSSQKDRANQTPNS